MPGGGTAQLTVDDVNAGVLVRVDATNFAGNLRLPSIYEDELKDGAQFTIATSGRFGLNVFVGDNPSPSQWVATVNASNAQTNPGTPATGVNGSVVTAVADKTASLYRAYRAASMSFAVTTG